MKLAVPKETFPGERRVALVPAVLPLLIKKGFEVRVEKGAGDAAGYPDAEYRDKGAEIVDTREAVFEADVVAQVRTPGANPDQGARDLALFREGQVAVGFADPLTEHDAVRAMAEKKVSLVSMELIPRITRAQSMDALSSMATVAGYKAVLLAADHLPKLFPMMMTAAGTLAPAKVFVIGAGVAGLQAAATAKRLGAVVSAYDVRTAVRDQVQSVGAKFVELKVDAGEAEDKGGYAKALGEDFYRKQRELMKEVLKEHDVVITTAAIPGKKAPILITKEMVEVMAPGSVIVDLAAERGGNCELTKAGEEVVHQGVSVLGPLNIPASAPYHASQMYAKNVQNLLSHLKGEEGMELDKDDEIQVGVLVTHGGEIRHELVRKVMGLEPAEKPAEGSANTEEKGD